VEAADLWNCGQGENVCDFQAYKVMATQPIMSYLSSHKAFHVSHPHLLDRGFVLLMIETLLSMNLMRNYSRDIAGNLAG